MKEKTKILAPSLLAGDHANLAESIRFMENAGVEWVHLDIMDGHFVPNLTFGPQTVAALRPRTKLFFDTHLMLDNPDKYVEAFAKAGSQLISIHVEPNYPIAETLREIHKLGCQNGIVLNPKTPAESVLPFLADVDLVLVMSVQPGFGGQSFQEHTVAKMKQIAEWRKEKDYHFRLEVDGGINRENAVICAHAGVDAFVAGTAFFKDANPTEFNTLIRNL